MKKLLLIVGAFCCLFHPIVHGQYAGFLGKRILAGAELGSTFNILNDNPLKVNLAIGGHFMYATSRYRGVSCKVTYHTPLEIYYDLVGEDNSENGYILNVHQINYRLGFTYFRKRRGALAPIGLYHTYFADMYRAFANPGESAPQGKYSFNRFGLGWEFGNNYNMTPNLVISTALTFRIPIYKVSNPSYQDSPPYEENGGRFSSDGYAERFSYYDILFFKLGLGYMF